MWLGVPVHKTGEPVEKKAEEEEEEDDEGF